MLSPRNNSDKKTFGRRILKDAVAVRTYAATKADGTKETHSDNTERVISMHVKKFPKFEDEIRSAFSLVHDLYVLPSMRTMQFAGKAIERSNARLYNCAATNITSFLDFADILWLSMNGCGVGYSVQRHHIRQLPAIQHGDSSELFVIPDDKEGWADSILKLLRNPQIRFDYSLIRDENSLLSTGGTASGPKPLRDAHVLIRSILKAAVGRQLSSLEVHDIVCHQADAVVVGGVRRAALICLFDHDDSDMLSCKWSKNFSYEWPGHPGKNLQRARANNSAVILRSDPHAEDAIRAVMQACYDSNMGDPGIFITEDLDWCTNPCQPASATLLTPEGIRTMGKIEVGDTIWSGKQWTKVIRKLATGVKPIAAYVTSSGTFIGTANHRVVEGGVKIEAQYAKAIDASFGPQTIVGDLQSDDVHAGREVVLEKSLTPLQRYRFGTPTEVRGFISGFLSTLHTVRTPDGSTTRVPGAKVAAVVQEMLSSMGEHSTVLSEVDGSTHLRITVKDKAHNSSAIHTVTPLGEEPVFDITVDAEEHTYWTGGLLVSNCGEISLRNSQQCNLSELNVAACGSLDEFLRATRAATIIGTLQASYTDFHYIQPKWRKNCEEEALLGVSLTGQAENWQLLTAENLRAGAALILATNAEWAKKIGINVSARNGCTKPSGSAATYLGTTSGIHGAHDDYYVRRMGIDRSSPIASYLISKFGEGAVGSNSPVETHNSKPNMIILSAPIASPGSIVAGRESGIDLLNRGLHIKKNWINPSHRSGANTHNVSMTCTYRPEDQQHITNWMVENRQDVSGVAFFPHSGSGHLQTPFESITEAQFDAWCQKFDGIEVDFSKVDFTKTVDERQQEPACAGGACDVLL